MTRAQLLGSVAAAALGDIPDAPSGEFDWTWGVGGFAPTDFLIDPLLYDEITGYLDGTYATYSIRAPVGSGVTLRYKMAQPSPRQPRRRDRREQAGLDAWAMRNGRLSHPKVQVRESG